MMDSSKRQDGIGGSRLFYIVRTAKFGYGSCGSVVTYNCSQASGDFNRLHPFDWKWITLTFIRTMNIPGMNISSHNASWKKRREEAGCLNCAQKGLYNGWKDQKVSVFLKMTDTLIHPFLRHRHHTPHFVINISLTYKTILLIPQLTASGETGLLDSKNQIFSLLRKVLILNIALNTL